MGRGPIYMVALAALLVLLPMLLVLSLPAADTYDQETRRMFVAWKTKVDKVYAGTGPMRAGEEECRYAVFKESRGRVARANAAGYTTSGLNGFASTTFEEFYLMFGAREGEPWSYEPETRRAFAGWKARYGKAYGDAGEEECRYWLFKGNRRIVVRLNAAAGREVYGVSQFGDLASEEIRERCHPDRLTEDRELSARCQADPDFVGHGRLIHYQVCRCIATELKQEESGGSAILAHIWNMWI